VWERSWEVHSQKIARVHSETAVGHLAGLGSFDTQVRVLRICKCGCIYAYVHFTYRVKEFTRTTGTMTLQEIVGGYANFMTFGNTAAGGWLNKSTNPEPR